MNTYLDIACTAVKIEMKILDFSPVRELVGNIFFRGFLMDMCNQDDPPFDGCGNTATCERRCFHGSVGGNAQRAARVSESFGWDDSTRS